MRTDMAAQKLYFLTEIAALKQENKELREAYVELAQSIRD